MTGRIVLLNGAPRAGKSSIARALQARGDWLALGVDAMMAMTPERLLPGIGLRPGGEKPELEDFVQSVDINPFVALPQGGLALDALIVLQRQPNMDRSALP